MSGKATCECSVAAVVHCVRCGRPRCYTHFYWLLLRGFTDALPMCDSPMADPVNRGCMGERTRLSPLPKEAGPMP